MRSLNGEVAMPKKEFKSEHKNLVKVLRKGSPTDRKEEAESQAAELAEPATKEAKEQASGSEQFRTQPAFKTGMLSNVADTSKGKSGFDVARKIPPVPQKRKASAGDQLAGLRGR